MYGSPAVPKNVCPPGMLFPEKVRDTVFIRLMPRIGRRNKKIFPIVITKGLHYKVDVLQTIGLYRPNHTDYHRIHNVPVLRKYKVGLLDKEPHNVLELDFELCKKYIAEGARPTRPVHALLAFAGLLPPQPYLPKEEVASDNEEGALRKYRQWEQEMERKAAEAEKAKPLAEDKALNPPENALTEVTSPSEKTDPSADSPVSSVTPPLPLHSTATTAHVEYLFNPDFMAKCRQLRQEKRKSVRKSLTAEIKQLRAMLEAESIARAASQMANKRMRSVKTEV